MMEYNFDTNNDGVIDQTGVDANGDGQVETWRIDTDGDMIADQTAADLDRDGLADTWNIDANQDGVVERVYTDSTNDGTPDGYTDIPLSGPMVIENTQTDDTSVFDTPSDDVSLGETIESILDRAERETDPQLRKQLLDLADRLQQSNNDMINVWLR